MMTFYGAFVAVLIALAANVALVVYLVVRRIFTRPSLAVHEARKAEMEPIVDAIAVADELPTDDRVDALRGARRWEHDLLVDVVSSRSILVTGQARKNLTRILELTGIVDERIAELESSSVWKRRFAADVLGRSYSEAAISPLTLALRDSDGEVRMIAAKSLGKLDVVSAIPYIASVLRDLPEELCVAVADTLIWFGLEAVPSLVAEVRRPIGDPVKDERARFWCTRCIANIGAPTDRTHNESAVRMLVDILDDPSSRVREVAIAALGRVGTARDSAVLLPFVSDESPQVRAEVATALGRLQDPSAATTLLTLFHDPVFEVAGAAGDALALLGPDAVALMRGVASGRSSSTDGEPADPSGFEGGVMFA